MKFAQVIMLLITVNLLNVIVGFSIQSSSIENFQTDINNWFSDNDNGFLQMMNTFATKTRVNDNWIQKNLQEIVQALYTALNLVVISFQIVTLVVWGWLTPLVTYAGLIAAADNVTFLKLIGGIAIIYLHWYNVLLVTKLYAFIKGSDA